MSLLSAIDFVVIVGATMLGVWFYDMIRQRNSR